MTINRANELNELWNEDTLFNSGDTFQVSLNMQAGPMVENAHALDLSMETKCVLPACLYSIFIHKNW